MKRVAEKNCIFLLTRGYSFRDFGNYKVLIQRNRRIGKFLRSSQAKATGWVDFRILIFHEGNINFLQQVLISILSLLPIRFKSVEQDFKLHPNNTWSSTSEMPLGYSLMCQFNYYHVWKYLESYDVVCRIDEDVWMESFPSLHRDFSLITGTLYPETHELTNQSLYQFLTELEMESFYNHRFPFTNFYVTKSSLWNNPTVQNLLFKFYSHRLSADHRWGDLPILGVTFNSTVDQKTGITCDHSISYRHLSHHGIVQDGHQVDFKEELP